MTASATAIFNAARIPVPGLVASINALDLSRLAQNSDGSGAVTADGQPIGRLVDPVSGWTAAQATAAKRPTYVADAWQGRPGIAASGSQMLDFVTAEAIGFLNAGHRVNRVSLIATMILTDLATPREIVSWLAGSAILLDWRVGSSGQGILVGSGGSSIGDGSGVGNLPIGVPVTLAFTIEGNGHQAYGSFWRNGVHEYVNANGNPQSEISGTTYATGPFTATQASLFGRNGTASFKGTLLNLDICAGLISRTKMEILMRQAARDWGSALPPVPKRLDRSRFEAEPWYAEEFDADDFMSTKPYSDEKRPDGWIYGYTAVPTRNQYGSVGAFNDELGVYGNFLDPAVAPYKRYSVQNSYMRIVPIPMPPELAALFPGKTYLSHGMVSQGFREGTFGLIEFRVRCSGLLGEYLQFWMMPANHAWHQEIDIHEGFSYHGRSQRTSNVHAIPYYPVGSNVGNGNSQVVDSITDWVTLQLVWDENGYHLYQDDVFLYDIPIYNGVRSITIDAAGSGIPGTSLQLYGKTANSGGLAKVLLTVSGGAATAVTIQAQGSQFLTQPTWYVDSACTITLASQGYGIALTADIGPDTVTNPQCHEPHYLLLSLGMGSLGGTIDPTDDANRYLDVDFVRWWRIRRPAPPQLTPGRDFGFDQALQASVSAIVARMTALGETPSAPRQNLMADIVRRLQATMLRFDTVPMTRIPLLWDARKLSLWDACDLRYFLASHGRASARVNWRNPGTYDLTEIGAGHAFTVDHGFALPGATGVYLDSGCDVAATQFGRQDAGMGIYALTAPTNATAAALCGFAAQSYLSGGTAGFDMRIAGANAVTSWVSKARAVAAGEYRATRGYQVSSHMFIDGDAKFGCYYGGNDNIAQSGTFKIGAAVSGTAGAAFTAALADAGRRQVEEEARASAEINRIWLQGVGALAA